MTTAAHTNSRSPSRYWFLLILLAAAILRVVGLWHGYPHAWSDEFNFVHRALAVGKGDLAPQDFTRPVFFVYLLFIEYGLFYLFGLAANWWSSTEQFAIEYLRSTAYLVILGRALCVLFSLATVWVVYRLSLRHFGQLAALIAGTWLAVNFGHVSMTQTLNADVAAGFFAVLGLYALLNYIETQQRRDLVLAAVAIGAGTATKYYPIVMVVSIFIAVLASERNALSGAGQWLRYSGAVCNRLLIAAAVILATCFVLTPFNFLHADGMSLIVDEFRAMSNWIIATVTGSEAPARPVELRAKSNHAEGVVHYFKLLFMTKSLGPIQATMAIAAIGYCLLSRNARKTVIVIFPLLLIALSIVNRPGFADVRHQVPMFPQLAVAVGVAVAALVDRLPRRKTQITALTLSLLMVVAVFTTLDGLWKAKPDARTLAKNWIEANLPPDSKILLMNYTVRLIPNQESIDREMKEIAKGAELYAQRYPDNESDPYGGLEHYFHFSKLLAQDSSGYNLLTLRAPEWRFGDVAPPFTRYYHDPEDLKIGDPYRRYGVESMDYYRSQQFEYVLVDGFSRKRFDSETYPVFHQFLTEVDAQTTLIAEFVAGRDANPGYTIEVRKIQPVGKNTASHKNSDSSETAAIISN